MEIFTTQITRQFLGTHEKKSISLNHMTKFLSVFQRLNSTGACESWALSINALYTEHMSSQENK